MRESALFQNRKGKDSLEDAAHRLYGCLAQSILVLVLIANILAYAFSARYRSTFPFWKFLLATIAWTGLTLGFWWVRRSVARLRGPFREWRPEPCKCEKDGKTAVDRRRAGGDTGGSSP